MGLGPGRAGDARKTTPAKAATMPATAGRATGWRSTSQEISAIHMGASVTSTASMPAGRYCEARLTEP